MEQDLEGKYLAATENVDVSILESAADYNVNLDELENFSNDEGTNKEFVQKNEAVWENLDVALADVVNKILATSERPVFVIRDDILIYLNNAAQKIINIENKKEALNKNFFSFVAKENWSDLAENIGEMLTNNKEMNIKLVTKDKKIKQIKFQAVYLSEIDHFSFVLLGEHINSAVAPGFNCLYDKMTGLPNFFLFEDRVQFAILQENEKLKDKRKIMLAALNIDNLESFRKMHIDDMIIKKIVENLVINLPRSATVAKGLKFNFWIMIPNLRNKAEINDSIRKIIEILNNGVNDNCIKYDLLFSLGVSAYPEPAYSAKKIIEQTLTAVKKAQEKPQSSVEVYIGG